MRDKVNKIKNNCKEIKWILLVIMLFMSVGFIFNSFNLIKGVVQPKESFQLEIRSDDFEDRAYHLIINKQDFGEVDSKEYNQKMVGNGETNYKAWFLIEGVTYLFKMIIVMGIILLVSLIMNDIEKSCRPFTKENIWRLRIISALVIVFAVIPGLIKIMLTFFLFLKAKGSVNTIDMLLIAIGISIGAISMLFEYGNAVQEEMDAIA